jgi:NAD(P)-dependent dehydrogenase (short-subunit alcohol dehydrogenase family)
MAPANIRQRVVSVASIGHRRSSVLLDDYYADFDLSEYDPWVAYGQSKTANIWMANEIDRRYGARGLHALSLHPGGIETPLMKHADRSSLAAWTAPGTQKYFKNAAQGAATEVYAAVSKDWEGKGGKWLSNCEEWGPEDRVAGNGDPLSNIGDDGFAEHAFDVKGAQTLWKDSLKMVGMTDE